MRRIGWAKPRSTPSPRRSAAPECSWTPPPTPGLTNTGSCPKWPKSSNYSWTENQKQNFRSQKICVTIIPANDWTSDPLLTATQAKQISVQIHSKQWGGQKKPWRNSTMSVFLQVAKQPQLWRAFINRDIVQSFLSQSHGRRQTNGPRTNHSYSGTSMALHFRSWSLSSSPCSFDCHWAKWDKCLDARTWASKSSEVFEVEVFVFSTQTCLLGGGSPGGRAPWSDGPNKRHDESPKTCFGML